MGVGFALGNLAVGSTANFIKKQIKKRNKSKNDRLKAHSVGIKAVRKALNV